MKSQVEKVKFEFFFQLSISFHLKSLNENVYQ